MFRSASLASLALLLAPPATARAADEVSKEPGVYWEQSVEMQMSGFSMPAQTQKLCLPKKGMQEPPQNDRDKQKCQVTDLNRSGSRMTWKMKCEDGTTGEGDITSGPDSFDGKMTMRTQGREMNVKLRGKKVGGDCDANEMKRSFQAAKKQSEDAQAEQARSQAQMCEESAEKMKFELFVPPMAGFPPTCKDPAKLCARLDTRDGLLALRQKGKDAPAKAEKLCKKDLAAVAEKLCAATKRELDASGKLGDTATMEFVFGYCPELGKALAKRECSGRKFTALPPAQRDFCTRWAEQRLEGGAAPDRAPASADSGKYLPSGIPDADAAAERKPAKKDKKKKPAAEEEDDASSKEPEDMKSRVLKGLFGR